MWENGRNACGVEPSSAGCDARVRGPVPWRRLLGLLIACLAFVAFTAEASAANYDMRGEWEYVQTCSGECPQSEFHAIAVIRTMEASGEFSGSYELEGGAGSATGVVSEDKFSVVESIATPFGEQKFTVPEGTVNPATNELTGSGTYKIGGATGVFTGKRLRTLQQVEEQEEKEKIEREEKEKIEKIEREARTKGESEGRQIGEKAGLEKGEKVGLEKGEAEGRSKTEQEVKQKGEQEAKELQGKATANEAKAKLEREAREKTESEAAAKADAQAREKVERETREKVEKEVKADARHVGTKKPKSKKKSRKKKHGSAKKAASRSR
jgi:hypothetical protein